MTGIWILAAAYCMGSTSISYLLVKRLEGRDIRTIGSGNAGATNVFRTSGFVPGFVVLLLDVLKGLAPVLLARALGFPELIVAGCAFAAVLGHVFPVFLNFCGGKGVATAGGACVGLSPLPFVLSIGAFLGVIGLSRYVSLASLAAA